ncbi:hypothetical protein CC85DRAFT_51930 [Cutaneotrichosporon oleaginosum]|uniref:Dystroglycan-type cadherin-like domain-containing protein n=1 Tax=Cutaneotrichosporon oleaginosum TaxID=879819 RepID=A0A0J0XQN4_9TREE|nr:uncharacterized protein CC85DRAFT_51930 [Cutaneotrichosporon oleaginosum]KLT43391.1 hypothetical protein CC85DRAFT_51930 [Cutaneotrichosporon oleaginosum]TXT05395.1 hypothetical protein COLE_06715 [Cutaneotrichosporon oleaginosum]
MSARTLLTLLTLAVANTGLAQSTTGVPAAPQVSATQAPTRPSRPFDPRMPIMLWHDGGQLPFIHPLTSNWTYRNGQDPQQPWRLAPGDTWEVQQAADMFEFGWRNSLTQLRTSEPGQAVSILTTCPKLRVQGELQSPSFTQADWTIILNNEVVPPENYVFNSSSAFLEVSAPRNSGVFNVTIQLGPTFNGTLGVKGVVCTTITERPSEPSIQMLFGQTGNRLSFVNGTGPQPDFNIDGTFAVENYVMKNNETVPALVLRGQTTLKYQLPPSLSHLQLRGFVGPNYGRAKIALNPPPPVELPTEISEFSTSKSWFSVSSFFNVPLDPTAQYTLSVTTDEATAGDGVFLDSLTVLLRVDEDGPFGPAMYQDPQPRPKRVNVGAIVGGAVGGVVGGLLIGAAVWYCMRRRQRPRAIARESTGYFEVDEAGDATPSSTSAPSPTDSVPSETLPPGARAPSEPAWHGPRVSIPPYLRQPTPRIETAGPVPAVMATDESPTQSPTRPSPTDTVGSDPAKTPRRPRRPRPVAQRPVVQEDDGGTLLPEFVPPRYNPEWALRREGQQGEQGERGDQ